MASYGSYALTRRMPKPIPGVNVEVGLAADLIVLVQVATTVLIGGK